jgi:hypothetical protein
MNPYDCPGKVGEPSRCFRGIEFSRPIDRAQLEDLLVAYACLGATRITDEEIRRYAELIVDLVKMRGVV